MEGEGCGCLIYHIGACAGYLHFVPLDLLSISIHPLAWPWRVMRTATRGAPSSLVNEELGKKPGRREEHEVGLVIPWLRLRWNFGAAASLNKGHRFCQAVLSAGLFLLVLPSFVLGD